MAPAGKALAFTEDSQPARAFEGLQSSSADFGILGADFGSENSWRWRKGSAGTPGEFLEWPDDDLPEDAKPSRRTNDFPALSGSSIRHAFTAPDLFQLFRGRQSAVCQRTPKHLFLRERINLAR